MLIAPCKNCPDRKLRCHSVCDRYITYQKNHNIELEMIRNQKRLDNLSRGYVIEQLIKRKTK